MKTLRQSKFLVIAIFFCICVLQNAYTEIFSSFVRAGAKGGTVLELLDGKYSCVSKLVWSESAAVSLGFTESVSFSNFVCNADVNFSIPNEWGTMLDFDYYLSEAVCQYSKHQNHLENNCDFSADFGYEFNIRRFSIFPFLGVQFENRKFSAWNGYLQIPETGQIWNGSEEKKNISGCGISYEQKIFLPFIKIQVVYDFLNDFALSVNVKFSPYFYADCTDTHYFRNKEFSDNINGGICIGGEIQLKYKRFSLIFAYEFLKSFSNVQTYARSTGVTDSQKTLVAGYFPGIECHIWFVGLGYRL